MLQLVNHENDVKFQLQYDNKNNVSIVLTKNSESLEFELDYSDIEIVISALKALKKKITNYNSEYGI